MGSTEPKELLMTDYDRARDIKQFQETKAGVKGLVDSGTTKIPRFFVHPPETLAKNDELCNNSSSFEVPLIDLEDVDNSDRRKVIVDEVRRASETWGFFQIVNHGIPVSILEELIEGVRRFHEQPTEVKEEMYSEDSKRKVRFHSNGGKLYEYQPANWKDNLTCSFDEDPVDFGVLPSVCRDIMTEYIKHLIRLKESLSELLSEALGLNLEFLRRMECMKTFNMVGLYYPACPEPDYTLGATKHSDPTLFTILLQDNIGGLQVLHQNQWVNVPPISGALVANIGDFLQLITNDKFKSVEHRVLSARMGPRISVPTFFRAYMDDPKEYGPIQELLSQGDPPVYRQTSIREYMAFFYAKGMDGNSALPHFKL